MTDKEIIKALECCADLFDCIDCPCKEFCGDLGKLQQNALDLINRQQAEKEVMQKYIDCLKSENHDYNHATEQLAKENRQLQAEIERLLQKLQQPQTEAIKEFAERLKEEMRKYCGEITEDDIDNLIKEMVGEQG
ncbi:MAG: hypothetical protein J6A49_10730 [Clostridia bacterium]|nr:hypothetical protein [Clostridia bacterium]